MALLHWHAISMTISWNRGAFLMSGESKIVKELERLKRQIRAGQKSLEEAVKKAENLNASIRTEMRSRQTAKERKKSK
jgi:hypothetical protein